MKKRFIYRMIGILLGAYSSGVYAEPVDSLIRLKEVVVSANKIEVKRNNVPLSISVIDRAEIEACSESALLPVLSERIPGLFVTRKGITGFGISSGSAGTVNIRGVGEGNKVLMLVDGQPQWAGVFGHALPDLYVASDVERVEVIRGPASLVYGSNAMGGVVNVLTRQYKREGRRTQARILYGSYHTQKYRITNGYRTGPLSTYISFNHDRTDGHRPDSKFHITNGFGKITYAFRPQLKVIADISIAKYKNQNPGKTNAPLIDNVMDVFRGTASIALENSGEKMSGAIRLFHNWGVHTINDGYAPGEEPLPYLFHSRDHHSGVLLYQSFRLLPGNTFTIGMDYKNWGGQARNDSIHGPRELLVDRSVNEAAGYLIVQQEWFDRLTLHAGLRYEHNSVFGGEWTPQAGLTFRPFEAHTWKFSVAKGFRSPTIREMYMFPPQNPDLHPERMINYEASVGQTFLNGDLGIELTAFYINGKDMIQVERMDGRPKNVNTGTFHNKGLEAEIRYRITDQIKVDMNYSFLHTDKALLAAPKHKFFAGLSYTPGRFAAYLHLQSVFGLYVNMGERIQEDYTVLNAKASYRFGSLEKGLTLFIKGENLTATRYCINEGFPMPKALCMGGLEISF